MKLSNIILSVLGLIAIVFFVINYHRLATVYLNTTGILTSPFFKNFSIILFENSKSHEGEYNIGTLEQQHSGFQAALRGYSGALQSTNPQIVFQTKHNLGNLAYKSASNPPIELFNSNEETEQLATALSHSAMSGDTSTLQILAYKKAISFYEAALDIQFDHETHKNLEFVQEKLRILELQQKQKQEKQKAQEEKQNNEQANENGDNGDKKSADIQESTASESKEGGSGNSGEENQKKTTGNSQQEEGTAGESKQEKPGESGTQEGNEAISEETKKALEQEAQKLQEQQGEIGQFYNKNYQQSRPSSPFNNFADFFGEDPLFDNSLLDRGDEKDW